MSQYIILSVKLKKCNLIYKMPLFQDLTACVVLGTTAVKVSQCRKIMDKVGEKNFCVNSSYLPLFSCETHVMFVRILWFLPVDLQTISAHGTLRPDTLQRRSV